MRDFFRGDLSRAFAGVQDLDLQIWSLSLGQDDTVVPKVSLTVDPRAPDTYRAVFDTDINNNVTIVTEVIGAVDFSFAI